MATDETATSSTLIPELEPAPGRCIVRIVPRIIKINGIDLDSRYEYQPMVGTLLSVGDPRNETEALLAKWAVRQAEAGLLFVFSQYGTGSPYWNENMETMFSAGYDFRWLQGLRLYDIGQLGAVIRGAGSIGQRIAPLVIAP